MGKYSLFLKQSNFDSEIINNSVLEKVEVSRLSNTLKMYITLKEVMPVQELRPFLEKLEIFFKKPGVVNTVLIELKHNKIKKLDQHFRDYYNFVVREIGRTKPRFLAFLDLDFDYKRGTYTVKVDRSGKHFCNFGNLLENIFNKYGLDVKVDVIVDDKLVEVGSDIEKTIKDQEEIIEKRIKISRAQQRVERKRKIDFRRSKPTPVKISDIPITLVDLDKYKHERGDTNFVIEGEVIETEVRKLRTATLLQMTLADPDDAILVKKFLNTPNQINEANSIKVGDFLQVSGRAEYDTYVQDVTIMAQTITFLKKLEKVERKDTEKVKRIEFHTHTKMSPMDAVTDAETYIKTVSKWGHKAIAFTDHNGVYAFPEIYQAAKKYGVKPIYGVEFDYVNDQAFKVTNDHKPKIQSLKDNTYVVFDIETTSLSVTHGSIIEIGAVKIASGVVIDRFQEFVNPHEKLSKFTTQLTNITDEMLEKAPDIEEVLPRFFEFAEGVILVAHNALFDIGHIQENAYRIGVEYPNFPVIDTLSLARYFYNDKLKRFGLDAVTKHFNVRLDNHHRADEDARATGEVFVQMLQDFYRDDITNYDDINNSLSESEKYKHPIPMHINVIAKNQEGYKNLFLLVSDALTEHYHKGPRLTKTVLDELREGLLVGSGCANGEIFELALNRSDDELREAMKYYDYIEVQPPQVYKHLESDLGDEGGDVIIEATILKIIKTAQSLDKIIITTGDVHYLNKEDQIYRNIYIRTPKVGGGIHPLRRAEVQPDQHLLTTQEMLKAFEFLGKDLAYKIVVENTNLLNEQIEEIKAFPDDLYSLGDDAFKDLLGVDSISEEVKRLVQESLCDRFGENVHPLIQERVDKELDNIISNNFAPIYYISYLLVKKSLEDGYLVGSRGSVGSSLVATLMGITEVNPLPPHYYCPNRDFVAIKLTEEERFKYGQTEEQKKFNPIFDEVQSGFDLPKKKCPVCGEYMKKDGHGIPFETFLGFKGDKVPDIDLNFSGLYQAKAHEYVRELVGEDYAFRAGTIQTVAERNAYGYVKGYLEENNLTVRKAQINRLASKIQGVRRSTGQHAGGIVVLPKNHDIYDVTPIQYPADDTSSEWKTTHFDYHSYEDNLLKLDILGHDDPTVIKYLMDYVHEHPDEFPFEKAQDIPLDDPKVYKLFSETKVIGVQPEDILSEVASYGIPEFGTDFVRSMLEETKPSTFAGLVKISGLSHGTDVWRNNAQNLVNGTTEYGKISFEDIIGCRDDIMSVLIEEYKMDPLEAFNIMEFVRKGKPSKLPAQWTEFEKVMKQYDVPDWYIHSAGLIKYMFPKAHAIAYVIMAMRIAWFKVHHPLLFYSTFFTVRANQFDHDVLCAGKNAIMNKIAELEEKRGKTAKDYDLLVTLGVALEMVARGYKFYPVDIEKSDAKRFNIEKDGLRLSFITIDGLGETAAYDVVNRRQEKEFTSQEDLKNRTKLNKTVIERLKSVGALESLPEESGIMDIGLFKFAKE